MILWQRFEELIQMCKNKIRISCSSHMFIAKYFHLRFCLFHWPAGQRSLCFSSSSRLVKFDSNKFSQGKLNGKTNVQKENDLSNFANWSLVNHVNIIVKEMRNVDVKIHVSFVAFDHLQKVQKKMCHKNYDSYHEFMIKTCCFPQNPSIS